MIDPLANITRVEWRLTANELDMERAEKAVFGVNERGWIDGGLWSSLDWSPFDEDDERPTSCSRSIEISMGEKSARWVDFHKIAAALGDQGEMSVVIRADAFWIIASTERVIEAKVYTHNITKELHERIGKAVAFLRGSGPHD